MIVIGHRFISFFSKLFLQKIRCNETTYGLRRRKGYGGNRQIVGREWEEWMISRIIFVPVCSSALKCSYELKLSMKSVTFNSESLRLLYKHKDEWQYLTFKRNSLSELENWMKICAHVWSVHYFHICHMRFIYYIGLEFYLLLKKSNAARQLQVIFSLVQLNV